MADVIQSNAYTNMMMGDDDVGKIIPAHIPAEANINWLLKK